MVLKTKKQNRKTTKQLDGIPRLKKTKGKRKVGKTGEDEYRS